jgi:lambda repressor-like predicted transcriptional regulator
MSAETRAIAANILPNLARDRLVAPNPFAPGTRVIPEAIDERRAWLRYQLAVAGVTFASIAAELGVSRCTPHIALWRPYPKMEAIIAAKIGFAPEDIWPERYIKRAQRVRR